ncbi:MAG: glycosyltransferase [Candidatus Diapherotrites archaeon]|nr:glycosyltransferase [Candidatus Diapherotrites archaeon]MBT4596641.1 glycosyltransferase [Candidatus Diapherotrites archaeon]
MKVLFFGKYHKGYSRNEVILGSLKATGTIVEELYSQKNLLIRSFELFFKGLSKNFDYIWVAYPGYLDIFAAKLLGIVKRKKVFLDGFTSIWDSEIEYGHYHKDSLKSRQLFFSEKIACKLADKIILDTSENASFFSNKFKINKEKFDWLPVGANQKVFDFKKVKQKRQTKKFRVLFYGKVTPMHGFDNIVEAATKLAHEKQIEFVFIGANWRFREKQNMLKSKFENIVFKNELTYTQLAQEIADADLLLGIFGKTKKANRVIPNKIFEPSAMKKPILTMRSKAVERFYTHKENIYLVEAGSTQEIKKGILDLKRNNALRTKIAKNAFELFQANFSYNKIGTRIKDILEK